MTREDSFISPKYVMQLVPKVEAALWELFDASKYRLVKNYVERWQKKEESDWNNYWENFHIYHKDVDEKTIDLTETLYKLPDDILIRMANDLGIDTPGFLPSIIEFKNILKDNNQNAHRDFDLAVKRVYDDPNSAAALATSALDGIIKTILSHETFKTSASEIRNKPLAKQIVKIVHTFEFDDTSKCPQEIITLASQLRGIGSTADDLRSDKTSVHGKSHDDYVLDDPLWASLTVNACATVGLFLWEYFERKYKPVADVKSTKSNDVIIEDIGDQPINLDDIPF